MAVSVIREPLSETTSQRTSLVKRALAVTDDQFQYRVIVRAAEVCLESSAVTSALLFAKEAVGGFENARRMGGAAR